MYTCFFIFAFFFFNDTATTEIYTLSLHDALPISTASCSLRAAASAGRRGRQQAPAAPLPPIPSRRCRSRGGTANAPRRGPQDRKSTRLNSSHANISYAVFCLKKKKSQQH